MIISLLEQIIICSERNDAKYISYSTKVIADYLEMNTSFIFSSEIDKDEAQKGEERIIDICAKIRADCYINAFGGQKFCHSDKFDEKGIGLKFLCPKEESIRYKQLDNELYPNLFIIDV